jgi:curli biogenesis system outer membrane secretion channel CsgG
MTGRVIWSLTIACAGLVLTTQDLDAQTSRALPPTLAIVEFEAKPGGSILPPPHLGKTLADLLMDRLVASGAYRVVDARWLPPVVDGPAGHDSLHALRAQLQAAGVDYVVLGSMTRFTTEDRRRVYGGAVIIPALAAVRKNRFELAVGITVRMVDVRSGEVATTATAQSTSERRKLGVGGAAFFAHGGGGGFSSSNGNSRDAMLDEAVRKAVVTAAQGLVNAAPRLARN